MIYKNKKLLQYSFFIFYRKSTGETINIDGQERSVFNSNGERIAKSEPALRNFYKWFGNSKAVDEQGRPLVMYHGTSAEFDTFDINKAGSHGYRFGKGFYFTANEKNARSYGGNLLPVYLKIEKPYFISDDTSPDSLRYFANKGLADKGLLTDNEWQEMLTKNYPEHALGTAESMALKGVDYSEYPKSKGYDGVIVGNFNEVIVFNTPKLAPTEQEKQTFLSDLESKQTIRLGKLPSVYTNLDWKSADVKTNKAVIVKDTELKHDVPMDVVRQLPELYSDPLLVFESATQPDRLVAVIDAKDNSGRQIIVALSPNKGGKDGYHFIPSFYGRTNFDNFVEENVKAGRLKYIKDNQVSDSLQLRTQALGSITNIKQKSDIVNSQIKSVDNRGTFSETTGNIYAQTKSATASAKPDYRGGYVPQYRLILASNKMDASTLNHELAHDKKTSFQTFFYWLIRLIIYN